ncbi:ABC transporter substrate-binding protein [Serratia odorifera]|uniref:Tat pathway signal sequence domain protein n=2 Tax=Serratia odorifera TaxID=618 RepID=D4E6H0_SEROD|nr:ABC transporter substrate-binding protein [Serratia odorifera]EFE94536.1 Tat pathway signal sequence domain protein [Serratia odorifera DSM 4582]MBJ2064924.1 ABC transporter substrate-binding protein [Serratia odorifera]PNK89414.1 ABC transporter substrate-binding protein [Serratia odorifera]RII70341.1 ABC transporter substrate-binding protein [Serratia odorifera]VDZ63402.1 Glutathione-binding protein gsiB precursor [Serratia odorifera]
MSKFRKEFSRVPPSLTQAIADVAISRRSMMKLLSAGALMSTGLVGFPSLGMAAETPVKGGKLRAAVANASATDTLDPAKGNNSGDYTRQFMFYNGLTELDGKLLPHPALAESLDSSDGITWHIKLRPGVVFHDGKSLTAQDVVFSLSRHQDPAVASTAISQAKQFASITAASPTQVTLVLTQPNFDIPTVLATSPFLILQDGTKDFSKAVGTGPYVCTSFTPGVSTVGVKNPNYWKPGLPHLDRVELMGVTDQAARVNALMSGDLHMVATLTSNDVKRLRQSGQFGVLESKSGMYTNLILRTDMKPGSNEDFVLGMKYLQPREIMVKTVMQGFGQVANDTPVPPWHPMFNQDIPQRPLDVEKAGYHFKKAGMAGASVEIITTQNIEGSVEGGQLIQQFGRAAGIKFQVRRVPYDGYWSTHWTKDPLGYGSINPRPTLDLLFSQFYLSDAPNNESGWKNPQFDQLVAAARGERDQARRKQMYGDMQQLIHDHCGTIIPTFISSLDGHSNKVKGVEAWPSGMMMGYRFHEFAWLAS